ncbi:MAG: type II toxin-antitoxin system RelE/ParE family toxin [Vicinamibacterales bacterium]
MARFRLARPAELDLASILATSAERWGRDGQRRYAVVLADAMRQVADDPKGPLTRSRAELRAGVRSFHVRSAHRSAEAAKVRKPVHVLYYRVAEPGVIEIVRVLHDRMDPSRHLEHPQSDA